jgi:SAM-dependent methyltransferase
VVVSGRRSARRAGERVARGSRLGPPAAQVVWHDLECGSYNVDLPLWRELADRAAGPVLELGAGTGRVTLELARAGHAVSAIERDRALLDALSRRAAGLQVHAVCADARSFALQGRNAHGACIVAMQTIQLLGGSAGRRACMARARAHLRPGGLFACAILSALEPFDCSAGQVGPAADRARVGGRLYVSRATRVSEGGDTVSIERERRVLEERGSEPASRRAGRAPAPIPERDVVVLDRVSAATIESEGREVGFDPVARREIPATDEHAGSVVVVLRA